MADETARPIEALIKITVTSGENNNVHVTTDVTSYTEVPVSLLEVLGLIEVAKNQMIEKKREDAFYAHLPNSGEM
jgi:hypothetical protein